MTRLRFAHTSLQFSDSAKQKQADVEKILARLDERQVFGWTGTEAGEQPLRDIVAKGAADHGYRVHFFRSNFVAIRREFIKPGSWSAGDVFVESTKTVEGPGHDSAFVWANVEHVDESVGEVSLAGVHYPTGWRENRNRDTNLRYAKALGKFGRRFGAGDALAFVGGDFNMSDRSTDLFLGEPFRTAGDELGKHENTGHGDIDAIGSWNADGRVRAKAWTVLDDGRFALATDHFYTEADFDVRPISQGARR